MNTLRNQYVLLASPVSEVVMKHRKRRGKKLQRKARVGEHQSVHQCETLPCPWQLRLRKAQQPMRHRALSQRHMLQKVGQNMMCSGNYLWIFSLSIQKTLIGVTWHLPSWNPVWYHSFSWPPLFTVWSDYMDLNLPQFHKPMGSRWTLNLKGK